MTKFAARRLMNTVCGPVLVTVALVGWQGAGPLNASSALRATVADGGPVVNPLQHAASPWRDFDPVDPMSLNPPAVQADGSWTGTAYNCWKLPKPVVGPLPTIGADLSVPGGTAIVCFHGPSIHTIGDGSLVSNPNGHPDQYFGFQCPDNGPNVFDMYGVIWPAAARYYDENLNLTEIAVSETMQGLLYNGETGKSAELIVNDIKIVRFTVDGSDGTFVGNDFSARQGTTTLAFSSGVVQYNYGNLEPVLLIDRGRHPLDDFYGKNDFSGLVPICKALADE